MSTTRSGHATWELDVSLVSQSQAGNYSVVQVHFYANADSGWTSGYASGIGFSASNYGNGSYSFGTGGHLEVVTYNVTVGHDANGYGSYTASVHSNDTTTQSYGGPVDLSQGITLPRIPKVPGAPGIAIGTISARNVPLTVSYLGDDGGATITNVVTQYSKDGGAWTGTTNGGWGTRTYASLAPGSYVFRAYGVNSVGAGYAANTGSVTLHSGGKVMEGGTEHAGVIKVRVGGAWRDAVIKVRQGGVWRDAL